MNGIAAAWFLPVMVTAEVHVARLILRKYETISMQPINRPAVPPIQKPAAPICGAPSAYSQVYVTSKR